MDIFAHTLWTGAVFYKKYPKDRKNLFLATLFGVLPDLTSFSPVFIFSFLTGMDFWELIGSNNWVVRYASESYNYTHSLVLFTLVLLLVLIIRKWRVWWPMFGWLLHILIDIPTHKGFYETPFLFPISDYRFGGIQWGEQHFMIINYTALSVAWIAIFFFWRKKRGVV